MEKNQSFYLEIEKIYENTFLSLDSEKKIEFERFIESEKFIFYSNKANLKNFISIKYDENKSNKVLETNVNGNKVVNNSDSKKNKVQNIIQVKINQLKINHIQKQDIDLSSYGRNKYQDTTTVTSTISSIKNKEREKVYKKCRLGNNSSLNTSNSSICSDNYNIHDFFQSKNIHKEIEDDVLRQVLKLFLNEKYSKILSLLENNRELLVSLSSLIYQNSDKVSAEFNIIKEETVYLEKYKQSSNLNSKKFLNFQNCICEENVFYISSEITLDFEKNFEYSIRNLISFYRENLFDLINILYPDQEDEDFRLNSHINMASFKKTINIYDEDGVKDCIEKLVMAENILKIFLKNFENIINLKIDVIHFSKTDNREYTQDGEFSDLNTKFEKINFFPFIFNEIKEMFIFFLKKLLLDNNFFNIKEKTSQFNRHNIFSDLLINRLGVFIITIETLLSKQISLNKYINEIHKFKNLPFVSNFLAKHLREINSIISQYKQFLLVIALLSFIKIYEIDISELNIKKFNINDINQNFLYLSLIKIIAEIYFKIEPISDKFNNLKKKQNLETVDSLIELNKIICEDILLPGLNGDKTCDFDFEIFNYNNNNLNSNFVSIDNNINKNKDQAYKKNPLNNLKNSESDINHKINKKYIFKIKNNFNFLVKTYINENVVHKDLATSKFKSCLYKIFICFTNRILDNSSMSMDIRAFLHNEIFIELYKRYFNMLFLVFFDCNFKHTKFFFIENSIEKNIIFPIYNTNKNCDYKNNNASIEKCNQGNIFSYFDLENVKKLISSAELKNKINMKKKSNLIYEYLLSDLKTLIIINKYWKIEQLTLLKNIFALFKVMNSKHRRYNEAEAFKNNRSVFNLIDSVFKIDPNHSQNKYSENLITQDFDSDCDDDDSLFFQQTSFFTPLFEFSFICTRLFRKILLCSKDEKHKKKLLSHFNNQVSSFITKDKLYNESLFEYQVPKLGLIPHLIIAFIYIELANYQTDFDDINLCITKIYDILDFNKSSVYLKGIIIAVTIKILLNYSLKNFALEKLIFNLNQQIKFLYTQIIQKNYNNKENFISIRNDSTNIINYSLVNNNIYNCRNVNSGGNTNQNINNIIQNEIYPTLHFLLNNLHYVSKEKPIIFVDYPSLLDEIKNLLDMKQKLALNYRQIMVNILINCFDNCEELILKKLEKSRENSKNDTNKVIIADEDMILEIENNLFEDDAEKIFLESVFINKIKNDDFIKLIDNLIYDSIIENKAFTGSLNYSISFPYLKALIDLYTKMNSVLSKYQIKKINTFIQTFEVDSRFFSSSLTKNFNYNPKYSEYINISNAELLDNITQLPFRAFGNLIKFYPLIFQKEILVNRDLKLLISFIKIFFCAIFYNNSYKNLKLTYDIFNKMFRKENKIIEFLSHNNDTIVNKNKDSSESKKETELFISEFLKLINTNKFQMIRHLEKINTELEITKNNCVNKKDFNNSQNLKKEEVYIRFLLLLTEQKISQNLYNFNRTDNIFIIFELLFDELILNKSFNKIEIDFFIEMTTDLSEILQRGLSLEYVKKIKHSPQVFFNNDNYSFTIFNLYFGILNKIEFLSEKENVLGRQNMSYTSSEQIILCFKSNWETLFHKFINDNSVKDISYDKMTIGKNLFNYCSIIMNKYLIRKRKIKGEVINIQYQEILSKTDQSYLNFLIYRIKYFLEFFFKQNNQQLMKNIKYLKLNLSKGFLGDFIFEREKKDLRKLKVEKYFSIHNDKKQNYNFIDIYEENKILFNNENMLEQKYLINSEDKSFNLNHNFCKVYTEIKEKDENIIHSYTKNNQNYDPDKNNDSINFIISEDDNIIEGLDKNNSDLFLEDLDEDAMIMYLIDQEEKNEKNIEKESQFINSNQDSYDILKKKSRNIKSENPLLNHQLNKNINKKDLGNEKRKKQNNTALSTQNLEFNFIGNGSSSIKHRIDNTRETFIRSCKIQKRFFKNNILTDPKINYRQNLISAYVNLINYISGNKSSYENVFLSRNYYFLVLLILNKNLTHITENMIYLYFSNLQNLFNSLNFNKFTIRTFEDFFFNSHILKYLDFSLNLNSFIFFLNDDQNKHDTLDIFYFNFQFISQILEYIFQNLYFILKYFQHFLNSIQNNSDMNKKFYNSLMRIEENIFKKLNSYFLRDAFKCQDAYIINDQYLSDQSFSILEKFKIQNINYFIKPLDSIINIINSLNDLFTENNFTSNVFIEDNFFLQKEFFIKNINSVKYIYVQLMKILEFSHAMHHKKLNDNTDNNLNGMRDKNTISFHNNMAFLKNLNI